MHKQLYYVVDEKRDIVEIVGNIDGLPAGMIDKMVLSVKGGTSHPVLTEHVTVALDPLCHPVEDDGHETQVIL